MADDEIETDTEIPEALAKLVEAVSEMGWCVAMPNCNEGEDPPGMIIGSEEYVDRVLAHLDAGQFTLLKQ